MNENQPPTCGVCEKGVESILVKLDGILLRKYYTIRCHGQVQQVYCSKEKNILIIQAFSDHGTGIQVTEFN